ncbi:MAG: hypothetical protein QGH33_04220 [Pirellulaceae bacterium]|nr:hypothetical protein [Pirellulaceae bacterium]HJN13318.1 hypothetical protein [Pirellulaceae bacterium]
MTMRWYRRLGALLAIGCVLIVGSLGYIALFLTRPIGSGPAGPVVDRARFSQVWSEKQMVLFGVGDSITADLGAESIDVIRELLYRVRTKLCDAMDRVSLWLSNRARH